MTIVRPIHTDSSPLTRGKRIRLASTRSHFRLIPAHAGKTSPVEAQSGSCAAHPRSRGENEHCYRGFPDPAWLIPAHAGKTKWYQKWYRVFRAHPRSRGENVSRAIDGIGTAGSSPLTRGKLPGKNDPRTGTGLIPAHAGKTDRYPRRHPRQPAHPRSRGKNVLEVLEEGLHAGSSPLTREKRPRGARGRTACRLIPAHAGKTHCKDSYPWCAAAHPRSRGENARLGGPITSGPGSSPLTRGKRSYALSALILPWLIPAHAGKTHHRRRFGRCWQAHPRSRGENDEYRNYDPLHTGSSPLTRGKHGRRRDRSGARGLIPAHAGKTGLRLSTTPVCGAHPRSRGENPWMARSRRCVHGSSPLTRGKRQRAWQACTWPGLIPAHAGKTSRVCLGDPRGAAHPRSRGENSVRWSPTARSAGSSPLTRGKR